MNSPRLIATLTIVSLLSILAQTQLYDPNIYSLGNNLVQHGSFDMPVLGGIGFQIFPGSIPGWTCLANCEITQTMVLCGWHSKACTVTWTQSIDLNTNGVHQTAYQTIIAPQTGKYLLSLEWLPPLYNTVGQQFIIQINATIVDTITVIAATPLYVYQPIEYLVNLPAGNSDLKFQQIGTPVGTSGIAIGNIKLQQLISDKSETDQQFQNFIDGAMFNNLTSSLNHVPGSRVYFFTLLQFLSAFDRLQFYYFHRQNLSYYSEKLLSNVNTIALERGSFPQKLLQSCDQSVKLCKNINNLYEGMIQSFDYQLNYTDSDFLTKNPNGIGFFANNLEFFFYELPGIMLIYVIFSFVFRTLFNYRISKFFRKYSFYGILLLIIYEGNIEQFTFYFFSECQLLFSANFTHKLSRCFMLFFFFFLLIFSVGGLTWFWFHYRKLVKYFMEDCQIISLQAILLESLERSVFPLLFGCVHAVLNHDLFIQSLALGSVELVYFYIKMRGLRSVTTKYKFKVLTLSIASLLRIILIVTLYIFEENGSPAVINLIHHDIVWLYLICWVVESLYDLSLFLVDIFDFVKSLCHQEKKKQQQRRQKQKGIKKKDVIEAKHQKDLDLSDKMKSRVNREQVHEEFANKKQNKLSKSSQKSKIRGESNNMKKSQNVSSRSKSKKDENRGKNNIKASQDKILGSSLKKDEIKNGEKSPGANPKTQVFVLDQTTNQRIPFRQYQERMNASKGHQKPRVKVYINSNGLGESKAPSND